MVPSNIKRVIFRLIFLTIGFLFLVPASAAAGQFRSSVTSDYRFSPGGDSTVEHRVTLTNLTSLGYPDVYELRLRSPQPPRAVIGSGASGPIKITTQHFDPDITLISAPLPEPATGKDGISSFTITYTGPPAVKSGQTWQISIPRFDAGFADFHNLNLIVPDIFGPVAYISPDPASSQTLQPGYTSYSFTQDDLRSAGVSAVFGVFRSLDFRLTYHLENSGFLPKTVSVELPPDTSLQRLFYTSITPPPRSVSQTARGNWLAAFPLPGRQELTVTASGFARLLPASADQAVPLPATLYDFGPDSMQAEIKIGQFRNYIPRPLSLSIRPPIQFLPLISVPARLRIKNPNGVPFRNLPVSVSSNLSPSGSSSYPPVPVLPPFATVDIPVIFPAGFLPPLQSKFITARVLGSSVSYNIPEYAFVSWYGLLILGLCAGVFAVAWIAHRSWHLYLQRFFFPHSLRRQSGEPQK